MNSSNPKISTKASKMKAEIMEEQYIGIYLLRIESMFIVCEEGFRDAASAREDYSYQVGLPKRTIVCK